jgi:flagellar hook protein FlgE
VGILSALNKSVGGLAAQSFALENIAGNIANSQTTAFKRLDTSFQDMVQTSSTQVAYQTAGNVQANSRATNGVQGGITTASSSTSMAVKGDGYFVAQARTGVVDNRSILSGNNIYTRTGDFELDREGYLVNGAGHYLMGYELDRATGNPIGSLASPIKVSNAILPAEITTEIAYKLNLPTHPVTQNSDPADPASELWTVPAGYDQGDPLLGSDDAAFLENSISGRAVTTYDENGSPVNVQFRWAKVTPTGATPAPAAGTNSSWQLFYLSDSAATATDPMWTSVGRYDFNGAGDLLGVATSPTAYDTSPTAIALNDVTVNGVVVGDVNLRHDLGGVTQQDDPSGATYVGTLSQDGIPPGNFIDVSIADGGRVVANYTNGKTVGLYDIPLVSFNADSQLTRLDGGAFAETVGSGGPIYGATGEIVGSSVEGSNVDIGEEFSKLIVTQQAFTANSRVITTADEMLTEVMNVVR